MMDLKDSPYRAVHAFMWAREWIMDNKKERFIPNKFINYTARNRSTRLIEGSRAKKHFW